MHAYITCHSYRLKKIEREERSRKNNNSNYNNNNNTNKEKTPTKILHDHLISINTCVVCKLNKNSGKNTQLKSNDMDAFLTIIIIISVNDHFVHGIITHFFFLIFYISLLFFIDCHIYIVTPNTTSLSMVESINCKS